MFQFILLFSVIWIGLASCRKNLSYHPTAVAGILDLRNWNVAEHPLIDLDGEWEYYPGLLSSSGKVADDKRSFNVPGTWNGSGYGTLKLKLLLPENSPAFAFYSKGQATAFTLYVNGEKILNSGTPGADRQSSIPDSRPSFHELNHSASELLIVLEISNFYHRFGGLWYGIRFGESEELKKEVSQYRDMDLFLGGIFFLTFLYHIGLFLIRRKDRSPLPFGLFCFVLFVRLLVTEDKILLSYFPSWGYETSMRLEYLSFYLSLPLGLHYLRHTFPEFFPKIWIRGFYILACGFALSSLLSFPEASKVIPYYQAVMFAAIILAIYVLCRAVLNRKPYAAPLLFGFFTLSATGVLDVLSAHQILGTRFLMPIGLLTLVLIETFVLSSRYGDLYREKEILTEKMLRLNITYSRFVPRNFLGLLEKGNIADMLPGDQVRKEMTILFSDIRSFTEISESMNGKESFEFLNNYLSKMEPVIRTNHGFVDKYFGDGIMALFSERPDDAVNAAIQMQTEILSYNRQRIGDRAIRVGIGIHTGSLILGLIGAEGRMESTVISEAVHVASRLEYLTKYYGANILISQDSFLLLEQPDRFLIRKLDKIEIKGKIDEVFIYEIGDYLNATEKEAFQNSKQYYEKGLDAFFAGRYMDAGETFREALRVYPGDKAANLYLKRCTEQLPTRVKRYAPGPDLA
ncbi:7TM diverse intracellular signaling domain-containing protein [Leptospira fainei]|nr:adenylate/guanylate cyclase domain-containing protein [Leptospira fainei]